MQRATREDEAEAGSKGTKDDKEGEQTSISGLPAACKPGDHAPQFYQQGGKSLERVIKSCMLTRNHKLSAGFLVRVIRAVLTGDRQATKVMLRREHIKAAQALPQLAAHESALAVSNQGQKLAAKDSAGTRKYNGTIPRRQAQPTERVGAGIKSGSADKGTNM